MSRGFTFFDIVAALLLIVIVGLVAIPEALGRKRVREEVAAVRAVRWIVAAQERYRQEARSDLDGDGVGEFGFLADLLAAGYSGAPIEAPPPGRAARIGNYGLSILLPDPDGRPVPAARPGTVDADLAEHAWLVIAWPLHEHMRGYRVYSANQGFLAVGHPNRDGAFNGWERPPVPVSPLAERIPTGRVLADPTYPAAWTTVLRREQLKSVARQFRRWKLPVPEAVTRLLEPGDAPPDSSKPR